MYQITGETKHGKEILASFEAAGKLWVSGRNLRPASAEFLFGKQLHENIMSGKKYFVLAQDPSKSRAQKC